MESCFTNDFLRANIVFDLLLLLVIIIVIIIILPQHSVEPLTIPLPQSLECWVYRCEPLYLALKFAL